VISYLTAGHKSSERARMNEQTNTQSNKKRG